MRCRRGSIVCTRTTLRQDCACAGPYLRASRLRVKRRRITDFGTHCRATRTDPIGSDRSRSFRCLAVALFFCLLRARPDCSTKERSSANKTNESSSSSQTMKERSRIRQCNYSLLCVSRRRAERSLLAASTPLASRISHLLRSRMLCLSQFHARSFIIRRPRRRCSFLLFAYSSL